MRCRRTTIAQQCDNARSPRGVLPVPEFRNPSRSFCSPFIETGSGSWQSRAACDPHPANANVGLAPVLWRARGFARIRFSFPSPRNEGSDAPRRRVVRITPDGPDDHPGWTRIAGSWRISGCAAPTRRATRHLSAFAFTASRTEPAVFVPRGGFPSAARGRGLC